MLCQITIIKYHVYFRNTLDLLKLCAIRRAVAYLLQPVLTVKYTSTMEPVLSLKEKWVFEFGFVNKMQITRVMFWPW